MAKKVFKGVMATFCPSEHLEEPALKKKYKGCSVYSYYDSKRTKKHVMLDQDFYVRLGTKEALNCRHKTNLEMRYNLKLVKKI